jgi:hypothetical protein
MDTPEPPSTSKATSGRLGRPPIASVSVTLPPEAADLIKKASEDRSLKRGSQVTQIEVNEQIVREMFQDIEADKPLIFYPGPRRDKSARHVRKTIWLPVSTVVIVKRYATEFGVTDSTFILTAILRWFERQGITFSVFLGTSAALNRLRLNDPENKMS